MICGGFIAVGALGAAAAAEENKPAEEPKDEE